MAVGMDVDVAAGGGKSEVRSEVAWFCQKCGTGNWWSRTDCRHCASVTNDAADAPQTSVQEKFTLEKTIAGMGNDEVEKNSKNSEGNSMVRRTLQSTWRPSKIGSTENPNASSPFQLRMRVRESNRERERFWFRCGPYLSLISFHSLSLVVSQFVDAV